MSKIRADVVIFDQGNTLILDPFLSVLSKITTSIATLLKAYKLSISSDKLTTAWKKANKTISYPHISHFLQEEPIVLAALENLHVPAPKQYVLSLELLKLYREALKEHIANNPENQKIRTILEALKQQGKRLGIFSDDRAVNLKTNMELMGINQYFDYVKSSEELDVEKPAKSVFENIQQAFIVPANRIVHIGDNPKLDIEAAKSCGFRAIWYKQRNAYQETWRDYTATISVKPDAIISELSEVLEVIQ
ncbi:MAG: HAD family hydrolase [Candidatus Levybacteria bacterium]|nr:HAD family hydrolase [Candidatus Levybacteria bacterium]